jgi:hypothetical protein
VHRHGGFQSPQETLLSVFMKTWLRSMWIEPRIMQIKLGLDSLFYFGKDYTFGKVLSEPGKILFRSKLVKMAPISYAKYEKNIMHVWNRQELVLAYFGKRRMIIVKLCKKHKMSRSIIQAYQYFSFFPKNLVDMFNLLFVRNILHSFQNFKNAIF